MAKRPITPESEGKLQQLYRLLMSLSDFKQASLIALYILENKLHDREDHEWGRILHEALNCAMIIAYCRPFSGRRRGDGDAKTPYRRRRTVSDSDTKSFKPEAKSRHCRA